MVEANEPYIQIQFIVNPVTNLFDDFADVFLHRRILQHLRYQCFHLCNK